MYFGGEVGRDVSEKPSAFIFKVWNVTDLSILLSLDIALVRPTAIAFPESNHFCQCVFCVVS